MQAKSKQKAILDEAGKRGELHTLAWFGESNRAGKSAVIMLEDHTLPVVPVVLWPHLDGHREQADLSRLLAELMCKSMRKRLGLVVDIQPALTDWAEMTACGVNRWEEWQIMEFDSVCPHCGAVNWGPCCADNSKMRKGK
jgi:hypothetical protein